MKKIFLLLAPILFVYLACHPINKTATTPKKAIFPDDWIGHYQGDLLLVSAEEDSALRIPMTLIISPTDTLNRWRWYSKSVYEGKENIKDYRLFRKDRMRKNHYIMDEGNGIFLDRILIDGCFYDYFEYGDLSLYVTTKKVGEDIHFEVASFPRKVKMYSYYEEEATTDTIISYRVVNTQKAILKKVKK